MNLMLSNIGHYARSYQKDIKGLAFVEGALILPMMITLLMGLFDIGQAIIINQKVTAAAHMATDLITRESMVNDADMADALGVAKLIIDPYDRDLLGIDVVGVTFDNDDSPEETWRYTQNMAQNANIPADADGLGINGEGVVAVTVTYQYTPFLSGSIIGEFEMSETSFMRGRKNSAVRFEE